MHKRKIRIIGVPMDLGQSRRGVDMGPSAARYAGLQARLERIGHTVSDEGNVLVPNPEEPGAESGLKRLHTGSWRSERPRSPSADGDPGGQQPGAVDGYCGN